MNADDYETLPTSSVAVHMTAGAFAGIMEHCVMYPLDSVKVTALFLSHIFFPPKILYITSTITSRNFISVAL